MLREKLVKRLTEPCCSELTAPCPSMDLIATVTQRNTVDVWRSNGQRVFGLTHEDDDNSEVSDVVWKSNGMTLILSN
jgi:anaphase-promoting complex subunit 4